MKFKSNLAIGFMVLFFSSMSLFGDTIVNHKLVRELHRLSSWQGMALVGENLFVSDMNENYAHQVHVYDAKTLELYKTIDIAHSVTGIYPLKDKGVIVIGRTTKPYWKSHMTLIFANGRLLQADHYPLGNQVILESAVSDGQSIYFNEKGTRGIYQLRVGSRRLKRLPVEISGPDTNMQISQGKLYVTELRDAFAFGDESLVEIDLASARMRRLAADQQFGGLQKLLPLGDIIVGVERGTEQAVFVDRKADKVVARAKVSAGAYGIARLGSCAVIVSDQAKLLNFLKYQGNQVQEVGSWDLKPAGNRLNQPRTLAIDEESGRIYVRSDYLCPSCSVTQSSVFMFSDGGEMAQACQ